MQDNFTELKTLIDEAKSHMSSQKRADRAAASRKLRQAADLALTLAITVAPKT